jgi:Tol biopolymer transport system component
VTRRNVRFLVGFLPKRDSPIEGRGATCAIDSPTAEWKSHFLTGGAELTSRGHRGLAALVTIGAILAGGSLLPGDALATTPGANGRIVFVGDTGLFVMNPDGTRRVRLTGSSGDFFPHWSPDGRVIAFQGSCPGCTYDEIVTVKPNGTGLTRITTGGAGTPSWSPDGSKIAFSRNGIQVVGLDGSDPVPLTTDNDRDPVWSPDGSKIAFVRYFNATGNRQIWIMDSDGTDAAPLTAEGPDFVGSLDWSPDATRIVFERSNGSEWQVWSMDADGSDAAPLTSAGNNFNPTWAPDGTKIGFVSSRQPGLWLMNPDGTEQTRTVAASPFSMPDWLPVHVMIRPSASAVTFGRSVRITAHLLHKTSPNQTVSIYKIPRGGSETLVESGVVDASGNFTVTTRPVKHTSYVARWSGDSEHPAGAVSDSTLVRVRARVSGHLRGFFGRSGAYRLYHFRSSCPEAGRGCPTYSASVMPPHAGKRLIFHLQVFRGRWRTELLFSRRVPLRGPNIVKFIYTGPGVIGLRTRARAQFKADADHLGNNAPWAYFKVTS